MARDTRQDMILSAVAVLRERGVEGVTLDAVLTRSGAPRGSIYHHFPGGRREIVYEALRFAGDTITGIISHAAEQGYSATLTRFTEFWYRLLVDSGYTAGCPVVSVAVGALDDTDLVDEARAIFDRWLTRLQTALQAEGFDDATAAQLATMSVAAVEGAVVMCRTQKTIAPLRAVTAELELLTASRKLFALNTPPSTRGSTP